LVVGWEKNATDVRTSGPGNELIWLIMPLLNAVELLSEMVGWGLVSARWDKKGGGGNDDLMWKDFASHDIVKKQHNTTKTTGNTQHST